MIRLLFKNTLVKIRKSFGRYLSLLLIVMVGVGFYAGIQASPPDIIAALSQYYRDHKLMDFQIVSTLGFTDDDVNALKPLKDVSAVIPSYSLDVLEQGRVIRVQAIEKSVDTAELLKGRMPQNDRECAADGRNYKIGDQIRISGDVSGKLKHTDFTVVGTVRSPLYLSYDYGNTAVGDGKLASFIFIDRENFTLDTYTELYVLAAGAGDTAAYSKEYDNVVSRLNDELVRLKPEREAARRQEIYKEAADKISGNEAALNDEKAKGEKRLADAKARLSESQKKLEDGYREYNKNLSAFNSEIADARVKIQDAKAKLTNIEKPKWTVFDRDTAVAGYGNLKNGTDAITSIAGIFPLFFILIVLLMTSNAMARMIAEERGELGTLASLGFQDGSMIFTYLFYVLSATVFGTAAGFFIGCTFFPKVIYACFPYILPPLIIRYDITALLLILAVAVALMASVTVFFCRRELKQKPAALMRPVPPQNGQTILLERVGSIWKHLSFTWKVTLRNLFRYKQRALMTIVGVAGCTALILTGFGVKDSVNGVPQKQYGQIFQYEDLLVLKNETQTISGDLKSLLAKERIQDPVLLWQSALTCGSGEKSLDAYLVVPENEGTFYKYFNLKNAVTGAGIQLDDSGVIISQKLSEVYQVRKGGIIRVKDADNNSYALPVSDVMENHLQNYLYMSKKLYGKVFGKPVSYNMIASNHAGSEKTLGEHLIDSGLIVNVNFRDDILQQAVEGDKSLNAVVILLVCVASLLAVIVLYNLTSINISERKREIATLKVLGFTDGESNEYIYREAFILTLISIGVGLLLGTAVHRLVMEIIQQDNVEYFKIIKGFSYARAFLITLVTSVVMQIVTYFKLKKIDMIESLKSVE